MIQPAPGDLEVVRRFLNTVDVEEGKDDLETPQALSAWLAEQGLARGGRLGEAERRRAVALRDALRRLALANNGEPPDPATVRALNDEAKRLPLALRFDSDGDTDLVPSGRGIEGALGAILTIVQRANRDGTWRRLKACREDTCQWMFFDESKNRSGRWCDMAVCGNRHKVREYRRRSRKSDRRR